MEATGGTRESPEVETIMKGVAEAEVLQQAQPMEGMVLMVPDQVEPEEQGKEPEEEVQTVTVVLTLKLVWHLEEEVEDEVKVTALRKLALPEELLFPGRPRCSIPRIQVILQ